MACSRHAAAVSLRNSSKMRTLSAIFRLERPRFADAEEEAEAVDAVVGDGGSSVGTVLRSTGSMDSFRSISVGVFGRGWPSVRGATEAGAGMALLDGPLASALRNMLKSCCGRFAPAAAAPAGTAGAATAAAAADAAAEAPLDCGWSKSLVDMLGAPIALVKAPPVPDEEGAATAAAAASDGAVPGADS